MNPFYDICDNSGNELDGSVFGTAFGALNEPPAQKLADISVSLDVSLKEFYCGSRKVVSYERQVVGLDGRTCKQEMTEQEVFIRPGMEEKQELLFKGRGNEAPNQEATNLIVNFKSTGDANYKRQGTNDLVYRHCTTLEEVINCKPVSLTTLDGRQLLIPID
jgi:DnaJ-class molecular chaperone